MFHLLNAGERNGWGHRFAPARFLVIDGACWLRCDWDGLGPLERWSFHIQWVSAFQVWVSGFSIGLCGNEDKFVSLLKCANHCEPHVQMF